LSAASASASAAADAAPPALFSVGSVVQFAGPGDVVWGAGVNGKSLGALRASLSALDVRAVRGPETRRELERRGATVPEVFGDPALLLPELWPALLDATDRKRRRVLVAPNLREYRVERAIGGGARGGRTVLKPQRPLGEVIRTIAESELVVGSSLHALIVAEALGVPAVGVVSAVEHPFKYADYYGGTGRPGVRLAETVAEALSGRFAAPAPQWDPLPLLDAFPADLWRSAV
jgi:pyruvyltransferase